MKLLISRFRACDQHNNQINKMQTIATITRCKIQGFSASHLSVTSLCKSSSPWSCWETFPSCCSTLSRLVVEIELAMAVLLGSIFNAFALHTNLRLPCQFFESPLYGNRLRHGPVVGGHFQCFSLHTSMRLSCHLFQPPRFRNPVRHGRVVGEHVQCLALHKNLRLSCNLFQPPRYRNRVRHGRVVG